jgi:hypothetical protein
VLWPMRFCKRAPWSGWGEKEAYVVRNEYVPEMMSLEGRAAEVARRHPSVMQKMLEVFGFGQKEIELMMLKESSA